MTHPLIHPVSQLFYFGNHLAIALLLNAYWLYAGHRGLLDAEDPRPIKSLTLRIAITAGAFAACLITAVFLPAWSWVTLPVFLAGGAIAESRIWQRHGSGNQRDSKARSAFSISAIALVICSGVATSNTFGLSGLRVASN